MYSASYDLDPVLSVVIVLGFGMLMGFGMYFITRHRPDVQREWKWIGLVAAFGFIVVALSILVDP